MTHGLQRLAADSEFAQRALENHFRGVLDGQLNKDAVLVDAIEDLRDNPPDEIDAHAGGSRVDEHFMERFEFYAEAATSEELRQKWGRVLAAEIRRPGTFSGKVLRIVDELEPHTALLFERLCTSRLGQTLPRSLVGELAFAEIATLTTAGLVIDPGLTGQVARFDEIVDNSGIELWFHAFGKVGLGFPKAVTPLPNILDHAPVTWNDGRPVIPVYVLTDVGRAISTILPDQEKTAIKAFIAKVGTMIPGQIRQYERSPDGRNFTVVR